MSDALKVLLGKLLGIVLVGIGVFTVGYAIGAFASWDTNLADWTDTSRTFLALFTVAITGYLVSSKNDSE